MTAYAFIKGDCSYGGYRLEKDYKSSITSTRESISLGNRHNTPITYGFCYFFHFAPSHGICDISIHLIYLFISSYIALIINLCPLS